MTRRLRPARRGVPSGPAATLCVIAAAVVRADPLPGIVVAELGEEPPGLDAQLRRTLRDESYLLLRNTDGTTQVWLLSATADAAAAGLQAIRSESDARDAILRDLADPDPDVRAEAVLSLGDIRGGEAIDLVSQSLHDDALLVREAAAAVLDELGATDYLPPDRQTD